MMVFQRINGNAKTNKLEERKNIYKTYKRRFFLRIIKKETFVGSRCGNLSLTDWASFHPELGLDWIYWPKKKQVK